MRLANVPRSTLGLVAAVVLATVVLVALTLVGASRWSKGEGGTYTPPETVVATRIDPPSALFGDRVEATARIVVDDRVVDPQSLVLDPSFKPFQAFTSSRRVRDVGKRVRRDVHVRASVRDRRVHPRDGERAARAAAG